MSRPKKSKNENTISSELQFKLALDYLYRQANLRGWDITANLFGAASDSIVQEYYQSLDHDDLEANSDIFYFQEGLSGQSR